MGWSTVHCKFQQQIKLEYHFRRRLIPTTDAIRYSKHNITFIDFIEFIATDNVKM